MLRRLIHQVQGATCLTIILLSFGLWVGKSVFSFSQAYSPLVLIGILSLTVGLNPNLPSWLRIQLCPSLWVREILPHAIYSALAAVGVWMAFGIGQEVIFLSSHFLLGIYFLSLKAFYKLFAKAPLKQLFLLFPLIIPLGLIFESQLNSNINFALHLWFSGLSILAINIKENLVKKSV